jgi:cytochrome c oxidase cbb3-type subunit 3
MNKITYVDDAGNPQSTHWNTRARLLHELQEDDDLALSKTYLDKVVDTSYNDILQDAEMMAFARSMAKGIFGDNCAACHGAGAAGVVGLFPNLADDDWLWGGTPEDIEVTIQEGRFGFMPAFKSALDDKQLDDVAGYVLSLSGHIVDQKIIARGRDIFQSEEGGCYYCHTPEATGLKSQGAANLTDAVWTVADVVGTGALDEKKAAVRNVIKNGVQRRMPQWSERLTPAQIKLLTVYVHELGGGQ